MKELTEKDMDEISGKPFTQKDKEAIFKEKVEFAKDTAKKIYEFAMREINCHNPEYKRKWIKHTKEHLTIYALEGTPDKAFVVADTKNRTVKILRQDKKLLLEF